MLSFVIMLYFWWFLASCDGNVIQSIKDILTAWMPGAFLPKDPASSDSLLDNAADSPPSNNTNDPPMSTSTSQIGHESSYSTNVSGQELESSQDIASSPTIETAAQSDSPHDAVDSSSLLLELMTKALQPVLQNPACPPTDGAGMAQENGNTALGVEEVESVSQEDRETLKAAQACKERSLALQISAITKLLWLEKMRLNVDPDSMSLDEHAIVKLMNDILALKDELRQSNASYEDLKAEMARADILRAESQNKLAESRENERFLSVLVKRWQERSQPDRAVSDLLETVEKLSCELEELITLAPSAGSELCQAKIRILNAKVRDRDEQLRQLQLSLDVAKCKISALEQANNGPQVQGEDWTPSHDDAQHASCEEQKASLTTMCEDLKSNELALVSDNLRQRELRRQLEHERSDEALRFEAATAACDARIEEVASEAETHVSNLESQVDWLSDKLSQAKQEADARTHSHAEIQQRIADAESRNKQLQDMNTQLEKQYTQLQDRHEAAMNLNAALLDS